jgi:hypothetical protein
MANSFNDFPGLERMSASPRKACAVRDRLIMPEIMNFSRNDQFIFLLTFVVTVIKISRCSPVSDGKKPRILQISVPITRELSAFNLVKVKFLPCGGQCHTERCREPTRFLSISIQKGIDVQGNRFIPREPIGGEMRNE